MKRQLPPLAAIRAFEAAARHLSFRAAAEEIHVTPSAISHQVRALEQWLGRALFLRESGGLTLTAEGAAYRSELTALLDGLDASTRAVARTAPDTPFTVHCTPGFAARWLAPRLSRAPMAERIAVTLSRGAPDTDFARNGADLVIQWEAAAVPGVVTEPLMQSGRYPVASPAHAARLRRPGDLLGETLLRDEVLDGWDRWFRLAGLAPPAGPTGPRLPHCELSLSTAERGQGVALAYDAMARGAIAAGTLRRLFDLATPPITIYSVAYPVGRRRCPQIRAFRDWLFAEVEAEGTRDRLAPLRAVP